MYLREYIQAEPERSISFRCNFINLFIASAGLVNCRKYNKKKKKIFVFFCSRYIHRSIEPIFIGIKVFPSYLYKLKIYFMTLNFSSSIECVRNGKMYMQRRPRLRRSILLLCTLVSLSFFLWLHAEASAGFRLGAPGVGVMQSKYTGAWVML